MRVMPPLANTIIAHMYANCSPIINLELTDTQIDSDLLYMFLVSISVHDTDEGGKLRALKLLLIGLLKVAFINSRHNQI